MVREYVERLYVPAAGYENRLRADDYAAARGLAEWKARVEAAWPGVNVAHVDAGGVDAVPQVGDELHVRALVHLNGLAPDDVEVQVVYGRSHDGDELTDVHRQALTVDADVPGTQDPSVAHEFVGTVRLAWAGSFGYTVRVVPVNDLLLTPAELGLVTVAA
jgi:starch phosphorylase